MPATAAALAAAYLLAVLAAPALLPAVCAAVVVGACALVLAHRPSPALRVALVAIAALLAAGLAGAWLLQGRPTGGFLWVVTAVFLAPLPVVPWLYARTFRGERP